MRRITDPAQLAAYRRTMAPTNAQHIKCKTGDAEAYVWTSEQGHPCAVAWIGRSMHPYSGGGGRGSVYRFRGDHRRAEWVRECFRRATAHAESTAKAKAEKAAKRAAGHALKVGDVLRSSWGYDQTNVDYYEVTALIGATMVEYRSIGSQSQATGYMQGVSVPAPGQYTSAPKRARVSDYGSRDSIKVHACAHAYKMTPTIVAGVKCFGASHWTAYA